MALVDYPSSGEDDGEAVEVEGETVTPLTTTTTTTTRKRKHDDELPPLPSKFHNLYASTTRVSTRDDPALHGGRTRVTPHVEGNWPTHVYIEWYPSTTESRSLSPLISRLKESIHTKNTTIHSFLISDLGAPLPLHISLSRPVGLSTEVKDAFVTYLQKNVNLSGIRPFYVTISNLDWVSNFEKTRWFLILRLTVPQLNCLNKLLHISNRVVQEFGQPTLYATDPDITQKTSNSRRSQVSRRSSDIGIDWNEMQDMSDAFHISVAWMLERPTFDLLAATKSLFADGFEDVEKLSFNVEEVKVKVGNLVTSIPLPRKIVEENALWVG